MDKKSKKILLWFLDLGVNLAIIFGLVVIIQTWIIAPFDVSGASMCDTLNNIEGECENSFGEKIIINEAVYLFNEPERGDIVVFRIKTNGQKKFFIKRIIGLPGDTIEIKNGEILLTKSGQTETTKIEEPYLNSENRDNTKLYFGKMSVFEVPEEHYFVLGDNRRASTDSRSCFENTISSSCRENPEKAYVHQDQIRGKAWVVWWPFPNIRIVNQPAYPELQSSSESLAEK